jgi:CheY-like chemotaxis protein
MNILIVEDDPLKSTQISDFLTGTYPQAVVRETRSFQSGLKELVQTSWDIVLLDMTLPTYDQEVGEDGGRIRTFGGIDIFDEISRRNLSIKVIVVTQFPSFGEGPERKTLKELANELKNDYPGLYVGTVYYHPSQSDWKAKLRELLNKN